MFDSLKVALFVGVAAIILSVACLGYVAWANAGSRNLALATATLVAACMLFAIQLPFELRATSSSDFFTAEYTIDREKPQIRQWNYTLNLGRRLSHEVSASNTLVRAHPDRFQDDREKLTQDMVIFSLLSYLGTEQFDWQLRRVQHRGQSTGIQTIIQSISKPDECSAFSTDQLHQKLIESGNSFADAEVFLQGGRLCLPPGTSLDIRARAIELTNLFCRISFVLEPSGSVSYSQPGTGSLEVPKLANSEAKLETRPVGVRATVEFTWIRAQHRDLKKYQEWSERVVDGAQRWFEGEGVSKN